MGAGVLSVASKGAAPLPRPVPGAPHTSPCGPLGAPRTTPGPGPARAWGAPDNGPQQKARPLGVLSIAVRYDEMTGEYGRNRNPKQPFEMEMPGSAVMSDIR